MFIVSYEHEHSEGYGNVGAEMGKTNIVPQIMQRERKNEIIRMNALKINAYPTKVDTQAGIIDKLLCKKL